MFLLYWMAGSSISSFAISSKLYIFAFSAVQRLSDFSGSCFVENDWAAMALSLVGAKIRVFGSHVGWPT